MTHYKSGIKKSQLYSIGTIDGLKPLTFEVHRVVEIDLGVARPKQKITPYCPA